MTITEWVEKDAFEPGRPNVLEIGLKERTLGLYQVQIDLVRILRELPHTLDLVSIQPLDTHKLGGYIAVSDPEEASALVAARIIGADGDLPVVAAEPWYMTWPVWVGAGAAVLVGGAVATYLIAGRNDPDRVSTHLGFR